MKLQAITVCVNYSDFLEHTLRTNAHQFDRWVVVTDLDDDRTREICQGYPSVLCISTHAFYKDGARFNKFAGMNRAIQYIDSDAWLLYIDGDIVLQPETSRILSELKLDPTCIYGIDRLNCVGFLKWKEFSIGGKGLVVDNWLLAPDRFSFKPGSRLVHYYGHENGDGKFAGWGPIGFFQLVHASYFPGYPMDSDGADRCDLLFAHKYPRHKRHLIPELLVIHLESKFASKGVNWFGRISLPFSSKGERMTIQYILKYLWWLILKLWKKKNKY